MKRNIEFNLNIFALPLKLSVSVSFICIIPRTFCRIIAINPGFLVKVVFEILFLFEDDSDNDSNCILQST